jgi:hypothetical protein
MKNRKISGRYRHISNYILNRAPINKEIRTKIEKWDYIILKSFFTSKETVTRIKRQPSNRKKNLCR